MAKRGSGRRPGPKKRKLEEVEERGVTCPHCGGSRSDVYRTYKIPSVGVMKRYRRCGTCGKNYISTLKCEK